MYGQWTDHFLFCIFIHIPLMIRCIYNKWKSIYLVQIYLLQFRICNIQVPFKAVFRNHYSVNISVCIWNFRPLCFMDSTGRHFCCWKRSATRSSFWIRLRIRSVTWRRWWAIRGFYRCAAWNNNSAMNAPGFCFFQVQDLEFAQIEKKVIDGLKIGNQCLKKMHEVGDIQLSVAALFRCSASIPLPSSMSGAVYWRSGTNHGWNSRCHRIPKGRMVAAPQTTFSWVKAFILRFVSILGFVCSK